MALESLVERTHREINENRVRAGMSPINFSDLPGGGEAESEADPTKRVGAKLCECGCGKVNYSSKWRYLRGHRPVGASGKGASVKRGRAKVQFAASDDMTPIISVIDQQIASLNARLLKLRTAREQLAGL